MCIGVLREANQLSSQVRHLLNGAQVFKVVFDEVRRLLRQWRSAEVADELLVINDNGDIYQV